MSEEVFNEELLLLEIDEILIVPDNHLISGETSSTDFYESTSYNSFKGSIFDNQCINENQLVRDSFDANFIPETLLLTPRNSRELLDNLSIIESSDSDFLILDLID